MTGTIIVSAVLVCIVAAIIYSMIKKKRSGKGSCHCEGGCGSCGCNCSHAK
ncbi:FeoB-associated Cys-rich membrane protein [Treponema sp.]|uniref:FeoB-associated Cys-rich membrane protein n=1 Tax=Treponema sp. TaxID=166 RepID=UPI0025F638EC|nr:FeoB-associated Cys-rich membrane protein [Treponema sp.]MCR5217201.1 FeoB-associated Cys-rich membrane protein [Treponema sp.]